MSALLFYQRVAEHLSQAQSGAPAADWIIATVNHTQGSTPRKSAAQIALSLCDLKLEHCVGTIGGGLGESRIIACALDMLSLPADTVPSWRQQTIDLRGRIESESESAEWELHVEQQNFDSSAASSPAGICGGLMQVTLCRISTAELRTLCAQVLAQLENGCTVLLDARSLTVVGSPEASPACGCHVVSLLSAPYVLISGAGHCGQALYATLCALGMRCSLHDSRMNTFMPTSARANVCPDFPDAASALAALLNYQGVVYWVLLGRNFSEDLVALQALQTPGLRKPDWIGIMGSRRRLAALHQSLPWLAECGIRIKAPVGLDIGSETPAEIAIAISAELIQLQRG